MNTRWSRLSIKQKLKEAALSKLIIHLNIKVHQTTNSFNCISLMGPIGYNLSLYIILNRIRYFSIVIFQNHINNLIFLKINQVSIKISVV